MSANGSMKRSSMMDAAATLDYPAIGAALGGVLGFAGVYLKWFKYAYTVDGGVFTQYLNGSEDWTGQLAFILGIAAFAFGAAHVILADEQIRRITGVLMGIASILLLGAALAGFFRADAATADPVLLGVPPGGAVQIATGIAGGLYVSVFGGVFALVGTVLSVGRRP